MRKPLSAPVSEPGAVATGSAQSFTLRRLDESFYTVRASTHSGLVWREQDGPVYAIDGDAVFTTIAVHKTPPQGVADFDRTSPDDWVATESRTGLAIALGRDAHSAATAALTQLHLVGQRQFEAQVKKQLAKLPPHPSTIKEASNA